MKLDAADSAEVARQRAISFFQRSPLKRQKLAEIRRYLPALDGLRCLDVGADNGVISYLFRQLGGDWASTDLTAETVESIRALVGDNVVQMQEGRLPLPPASFDLIVIVDMLEHLDDDRGFVAELARIAKPGAQLIVNVPDPRPGLTRRLKNALGQDDTSHGHVRPGYSHDELRQVLAPHFTLETSHSYRKFPTDLLDCLLTFAVEHAGGGSRGQKGVVLSAKKKQKKWSVMDIASVVLQPVFAASLILDRMAFWLSGNLRVGVARKA